MKYTREHRCRHGRKPLLAISLCAALAHAGPTFTQPQDWPSLQHDYVAFTHIVDPLRAGARGDRDALVRWPDHSPQALAEQKTALEGFKTRLQQLSAASLAAQDALSMAVMTRQLDLQLESVEFDEARMPFQTGEGFFTLPDTQAQVTTLANEADAQAWLKRMAAIGSFFATETANLERGIDTGFTQPELVVRAAIETLETAARLPPEQSPLLLPFATIPASVPAARRAELTAQARQIVLTQVQPAQARLAKFMEDRYLPRARSALSASSLPDGQRYYAFTVRRETTTSLRPDEIHALGLSEVARIRVQMQTVMTEAGFGGGIREFAAKLKADPRQYPQDLTDYAGRAAEIAKRIDYLLPRYFGLLPRLTYGIRAKPAALQSTSDGYLPGSPEAGQAGMVVYNAATATQSPLYSLPAWLLHEGVPGHHLQISLAQENTALPEFRRDDDITAFVEGWALYSERLGEEMGVYRNAEERFGRLSMEMWRACRLIMDTGLHALGWSREQALACLKDNTAMTEASMSFEVDRYIGWPAQALGYKIGELRIEKMRRDAEHALGSAFNLREFHDVLLGEGALPMDLLERQGTVVDPRSRPSAAAANLTLVKHANQNLNGESAMVQQSLIPCLRYADALAAIDFLCRAFGFVRHAVYADDTDPSRIHHAQLALGNSMVMLSSAIPGPAAERYRWRTPAEAGGITACVCCVIDDPDSHFERAKAAGAEIVTEPHANEGYPGRSYNVRDPEGNDWDFGTYDPWATP